MPIKEKNFCKRKFSVRDPRTFTESDNIPGDVYIKRKKNDSVEVKVVGTDARERMLDVESSVKCERKSESVEVNEDFSENSDLLKVEARVLGRRATVLIDGGAQDNFVSRAFVNHLHARIKLLKEKCTAVMADGRTYSINVFLPGFC